MILKWQDRDYGQHFYDGLEYVRLVQIDGLHGADNHPPRLTGRWRGFHTDDFATVKSAGDAIEKRAYVVALEKQRPQDVPAGLDELILSIDCCGMWLMNDKGDTVDTLVAYEFIQEPDAQRLPDGVTMTSTLSG